MSGDTIEIEGTILAEYRGGMYSVEADIAGTKRTVLARKCGKMVRAHLRIVPGDRVRVELSPYDTQRGRITYRLTGSRSA